MRVNKLITNAFVYLKSASVILIPEKKEMTAEREDFKRRKASVNNIILIKTKV